MPSTGQPSPPRWMSALEDGARAFGVQLEPEALRRLDVYVREILRWQARVNLTGFKGAEAIVRGGILDSLTCLLALPVGPLQTLDIGSGAGFPGLPLRIAQPRLAVTLIEANRRRHSFLLHICRLLEMADVRCLHGRAESWAHEPGMANNFDAAFARAVGRLGLAAQLAAPFLRPGGIFVGQQARVSGISAVSFVPGYGPPRLIPLPQATGPVRTLLVYPRGS